MSRLCARRNVCLSWTLVVIGLTLPASARAQGDDANPLTDPVGQLPYGIPRETMIPGTPGMPGGFHLMMNAFAHAEDPGLGGYRINNEGRQFAGGAVAPILNDDWAMGYGREAHGWVEALFMLNFEPFTIGPAGYPEVGQSGEGLYDAQHAHQFIHQAMIAFHPLTGVDGWHPDGMIAEGEYDLSMFAGQGSATIGPPVFMHRASNPGPTVPRKHHKGENPHETFPVIGASLRIGATWLEVSAFSALELFPDDSRFYPHVAPPASAAARVRHVFGGWLEVQGSGERLRNQGHGEPDAWQGSASAYAWGWLRKWRIDGLLDYAIDVPDRVNGEKLTAQALLGEFAIRDPRMNETLWLRSEFNQREESAANGGGVSTPWFFETLGFEHLLYGGGPNSMQVGTFGEATFISIPSSLQGIYGRESAVTVNVGLHVFGMWMLDGNLRPMQHAHAAM